MVPFCPVRQARRILKRSRFESPDSLWKVNSRKFGGKKRGRGRHPPTLQRPSYEEEGCIGCFGVEYRRGSTGGASSSISGPIASGSATYSNWPVPTLALPSWYGSA